MYITFDENPLAGATVVPREARQVGHNIDLPESERPTPPIPSRPQGADVPPAGAGASFPPQASEVTPNHGLVEGAKEYTSLGDRGNYDSKANKKVPWHRTTKGIIILTILALVIIAAAVGGGVGGALSGKSNNNAVPDSSTTSPNSGPASPTTGTSSFQIATTSTGVGRATSTSGAKQRRLLHQEQRYSTIIKEPNHLSTE